MDWKDILAHPFTKLSALFSLLTGWGFGLFDPVFGLVSVTSGYWFPAVSAFASFVLPQTDYAALATPLLVGVAIAYVAVQLEGLVERAREYLRNR